jgi:flagellar motor switch protein FliN/FliY
MTSAQIQPQETRLTRKLTNYEHVGNMRLRVAVELGRKVVSLDDVSRLRKGDVIDLAKLAGEPFDLLVNGHRFAEGEIVVVTDTLACRITRMMEP